MTTDQRSFPDGSIEWADRPAGEVPPGIVPVASPLDQIAGQAHLNGLATAVRDQFVVCFCQNGQHPETEYRAQRIWSDGEWEYVPAWHARYDAAQVDQAYSAGTSHIVHRRDLRITGHIEVAA